MTQAVLILPEALAAAGQIAATLDSPGAVLSAGDRSDGKHWPQSLAGGAAGIALLHVERARSGHGDWDTARAWLAAATSGGVTAASNAHLFFGAPALAYVFHIAAASAGRGRRALAVLDDATLAITRAALARARARMQRAVRPELREFDLVRGLAGLGAYHLARHPGHEIIGAVLAVLSMSILRGIPVPGAPDAVHRICAWTDQWRLGSLDSPWWPGVISLPQAQARHIDPALRPRPSWCYGTAGTARAQQLAGLALREPARRAAAETALAAVLRDPAELGKLTQTGLCHGTAGFLQATWRIAADADTDALQSSLACIAARLTAQLSEPGDGNPELMDGRAGAALALHTAGTGSAPEPCWDAFLALA